MADPVSRDDGVLVMQVAIAGPAISNALRMVETTTLRIRSELHHSFRSLIWLI